MVGKVTYKVSLEKLGGTDAEKFIGRFGDLFFDPTPGEPLGISNGTTPGGIELEGGGCVDYNDPP